MSARRMLWRWTLRGIRREWRQFTIIFSLITIGVALAVGASLATYNLVEPPESEFGGARLGATAGDPARFEAELTEAGHPFSAVESATLRIEGSAARVDGRVLDPNNSLTAPLITLLEGRWPNADDEAAITNRVLIDGPSVGETVEVRGRTLQIVAEVENPTDLSDEFVLLTSLDDFGLRPNDTSLEYLVDADPAQLEGLGGGVGVRTSGSSVRTALTVAVSVVSAFGLLEVALLVSAGFAAVARRRTHQYGLLAATGATPAQIRSAAAATGSILGGSGAGFGLLIGLAASVAFIPRMEEAVGHRIAFDVPWWSVLPNVALAVLVATLAARWPARPLSRVPVAHLLRAMRPRRSTVGRPAILGAVLAAGGVAALATGFARLNTFLALLGVVLAPIGLLLTAPLLVRGIERIAGRLPLPIRMASRALGRHNRRSAAIVAALALALAVPVGLAVVSASIDQRAAAAGPNIAETSFIAWLPGADDGSIRIPVGLDQSVLAEAGQRIEQAAPGLNLVRIDTAVDPNPLVERWEFGALGSQLGVEPVLAGERGDQNCLVCDTYGFGETDADGNEIVYVVEGTWIADPGVLAALGIETDPGTSPAVAASTDWRVIEPDGAMPQPPVVFDDWPRNSRIPKMLLSPHVVETGGFERVGLAWHASSPAPITTEQREVLRAAVGPELLLEFHAPPEPSSGLRGTGLLLGLFVGTGIAAASVGLLAAEVSDDLRILSTIGASPRMARALGASIAGLVALAGAGIAFVIGYVSLVPLLAANGAGFRLVAPWGSLAGFTIVFPALASALGWLLGGRADNPAAPPAF